MQAIEGADAEFGAVAVGEIGADSKCRLRHRCFKPNGSPQITVQIGVSGFCLVRQNSALKHLLCDGMKTLCQMKGSKANLWVGLHQLSRSQGMTVPHVE